MPTNQQFHPTIHEESPIGGSTSFGAENFIPNIHHAVFGQPTGTTGYTATYQKLGRLLFFNVVLFGTTLQFNLGTFFTLPIAPSKFPPGHALAGQAIAGGMAQTSNAGLVPFDVINNTFPIPNVNTAGPWRITGWYWVD